MACSIALHFVSHTHLPKQSVCALGCTQEEVAFIVFAAAGPFTVDQMPSNSDIIFDCIRVTWVAMIICILFFEMNLASALWTGIITGLAYTLFVRAMYQSQLDVLHRDQALRNGRAQPANAAVITDGASAALPSPAQQPQQQHPYVIVV